MYNRFIFSAFLIFVLPVFINAQLRLKLNLETGAYIELNDSTLNKVNSIHRLFGSIKYGYKKENREFSFNLKIRPQFFENRFHSIKYGFNGFFTYNTENILWKSNLFLSQYNYNFSLLNSFYNNFSFINMVEFNAANNLPVNLLFGYSYLDINYEKTITSDYLFLSTLASCIIDKYSYFSFGIYVQKFVTESDMQFNSKNFYSKGWKYGPQAKIHYLRKFLFEAEYKFLIQNSNYVVYPSYEHNINLLSGIIIGRNFLIFLLVEFYYIRTNFKSGITEQNPIYFIPKQNENQVYLKSAYKWNKGFSVYSKFGYFRENLYLDAYKLDGLNFLIGIEIKN